MRLLNIGCGPKGAPVPVQYEGWEVVRLDIEPRHEPDLLMDALDIGNIAHGQFDASYASHFLEHIYPVDLERFFIGLYRALSPEGWCEFRVPDALAACVAAAEAGTLEVPCYESAAGTVTAWDILYGYLPFQMAMGRNMTHHNAFSRETLTGTLQLYGFDQVYVARNQFEMCAIGCKTDLPDAIKEQLGVHNQSGNVHPDAGTADLEPVRQLRAVADVPPRAPSRGRGDGHEAAPTPAGGHGQIVARFPLPGW